MIQNTALSRMFALLLLLGTGLLLYGVVGIPLKHAYQKAADALRFHQAQLEKSQSKIRQEVTLRQSIERLRQKNLLQDLFISNRSNSAAIAFIQNKLQSIVSGVGGQTVSFQALEPKVTGSLVQIGIRVSFQSNAEALRKILHVLEYGRPVMVLDNISIHGLTSRAQAPVKSLNVLVDVYTFVRKAA